MHALPSLPPALTRLAAALALIAGAGSAQAVDFDGYFRTGPGGTSQNSARACYDLGIIGGHYRLGNECNLYGEFGLAQTGNADGVAWKAKVMFNEFNPGTDVGNSYSSFEQMYVEGKGFDIAPDTNFWIGKRFYGRADVHILDKFFVQMDGVGAGAEIPVGGAKLGLAYFSSDSGKGFGDSGTGASTNPAARLNADLTDVSLGTAGKLRVTGTYTSGRFNNPTDGKGTDGVGLSVQHNLDLAGIGGGNTLWVQYAQGSAGLNANFGNMTAPSSVKQFMIVESMTWQVGAFGGQAVALWGQQDKNDVALTPKTSWISVGGRGSYALTKNFKLITELGYMEKNPDGQPKQNLTKLTFAPTLSTGPGFWNRPELRMYVTTAKWNSGAAGTSPTGPNGITGLANDKTSGTSYGFQAEVWF